VISGSTESEELNGSRLQPVRLGVLDEDSAVEVGPVHGVTDSMLPGDGSQLPAVAKNRETGLLAACQGIAKLSLNGTYANGRLVGKSGSGSLVNIVPRLISAKAQPAARRLQNIWREKARRCWPSLTRSRARPWRPRRRLLSPG